MWEVGRWESSKSPGGHEEPRIALTRSRQLWNADADRSVRAAVESARFWNRIKCGIPIKAILSRTLLWGIIYFSLPIERVPAVSSIGVNCWRLVNRPMNYLYRTREKWERKRERIESPLFYITSEIARKLVPPKRISNICKSIIFASGRETPSHLVIRISEVFIEKTFISPSARRKFSSPPTIRKVATTKRNTWYRSRTPGVHTMLIYLWTVVNREVSLEETLIFSYWGHLFNPISS